MQIPLLPRIIPSEFSSVILLSLSLSCSLPAALSSIYRKFSNFSRLQKTSNTSLVVLSHLFFTLPSSLKKLPLPPLLTPFIFLTSFSLSLRCSLTSKLFSSSNSSVAVVVSTARLCSLHVHVFQPSIFHSLSSSIHSVIRSANGHLTESQCDFVAAALLTSSTLPQVLFCSSQLLLTQSVSHNLRQEKVSVI